jgi:hypothetical protein
MEHSPAISAGDHERPFGVCLAAKNSILSQDAQLHPRSNPRFTCSLLLSRVLTALEFPEVVESRRRVWDTANDDVALSVRCVIAAITAFIITPSVSVFEKFLPSGVWFIGRETPSSYFLSKRLCMDKNREDNDSARLQNIVHFLPEGYRCSITVHGLEKAWWTSSGRSTDFFTSPAIQRSTAQKYSKHTGIPAVRHDLLAVSQ